MGPVRKRSIAGLAMDNSCLAMALEERERDVFEDRYVYVTVRARVIGLGSLLVRPFPNLRR